MGAIGSSGNCTTSLIYFFVVLVVFLFVTYGFSVGYYSIVSATDVYGALVL
jgi:hypothetical protein